MNKPSLGVMWGIAFTLTSCAMSNNYRRPEMKAEDRADFMLSSGGYLRNDVRIAFVEGRLIPGAPLFLVEALYGEADLVILCPIQSLECDKVLVYGKSETETFGSVSVMGDTVKKVSGQLATRQRF